MLFFPSGHRNYGFKNFTHRDCSSLFDLTFYKKGSKHEHQSITLVEKRDLSYLNGSCSRVTITINNAVFCLFKQAFTTLQRVIKLKLVNLSWRLSIH